MTFDGKSAVVTGAGAGIGRATAELLGRRGARVCLVDRDPVGADVAAGITDAIFVEADVSRGDECARAVAAAVEAFEGLDILVCSAGIQRYGNVADTPEETWDEVIGVNLTSMYLMAHQAVPHLERAGSAAIVNVASVQGFAAQKGVAAYAASKGGAIALTRAMAVDHAPAIRVNCVCPGSVDTPMLRNAAELFGGEDVSGTVSAWGEMHPMGRVARPEEVAEAVAWLASDASSFVTGAALLVDGGLLSRIGGT